MGQRDVAQVDKVLSSLESLLNDLGGDVQQLKDYVLFFFVFVHALLYLEVASGLIKVHNRHIEL